MKWSTALAASVVCVFTIGYGVSAAEQEDGWRLLFDGTTTNAVDLGNDARLQFSAGTVEAWINTTDTSYSDHTIFAKHGAFGLYVYNGELRVLNVRSGSTAFTGVNVADGQWHHIALSFNDGVVDGTRIYIDGEEVLVTTTDISNQDRHFKIGARDNGSYYSNAYMFKGLIDEVAIFDKAAMNCDS